MSTETSIMAGIYACKCKGKSTVMSMHVASAAARSDTTNKKSPGVDQIKAGERRRKMERDAK
jgi:hypothetical protein